MEAFNALSPRSRNRMYIILKTVLFPPRQMEKLRFGEKHTAMWRSGKQAEYDSQVLWNLTAAIQWYTVYYLIFIKPRYEEELLHLHVRREQKKEKLV